MADAIVSFAVKRLGDYLIQRAVFLGEVKNKVAWVKKELEWMLCFIEDAEQEQFDGRLFRQWLSDITDIAYDIEDVLDKYMLRIDHDGNSNLLQEDGRGNSGRKHGVLLAPIISCIFHKESGLFNKGKNKVDLYRIGKEIEALKYRINDLSRKRELFFPENIVGISREGKGRTLKQIRKAASFAVEENLIGFFDDADRLLTILRDKEEKRLLISVYGMGGLGKTTLAGKLYHDKDVKSRYDCCAWVSVTQDYNIQDLLQRIIKSFRNIVTTTEELERMSEDDLERCLHEYLRQRSYLVVIDDVWQKEVWQSLKRAFPDNNTGSRVIITTREKEVAERSDERTHVHKLRFLTPEESWQLFCKKAFGNSKPNQTQEMLGREMVEKCGGLPLAIVVLGGLLSKMTLREWRMVRNQFWQLLKKDSIEISYLLILSFNKLPYQLKLCFLYLGLFPEDSELQIENLIRLLVAEGLIPQDQNRVMEDVAKDNLDELMNRSLINVDKRCWGRTATCRVHHLLRELAVEKARELRFLHICDMLYENSSIIERQFAPLFKRYSCLRVLHIEASEYVGTGISTGQSVPKEIGELSHLKYLGLMNAQVNVLPSSIVNLQRLETLDLSSTFKTYLELPTEISRLQELRHLIGKFKGSLEIENLINLQTLKVVEVESWNKINPDKLVNLRELHIEENEGMQGAVFAFDSIAKLEKLRMLSVKLLDGSSFGSLQPLFDCTCLEDLRLSGRMKKLPGDMRAILPNLECLSLKVPCPVEDPMPVLETLPNLTFLDLNFNSVYVKKLFCKAQGFPQLEVLQIDSDGLEEVQVEDGAMPMLRGFRIPANSSLRIPENLRSIPLPENCNWNFY
ncbi:Disease resistance protein [Melia azedarach]|uniref:Disease resistance protein n=1 Tax=Melia azedarach TaxID=155640 RepID=A0ACC1YLJ0_MELAZ|nr:Disease resistance protein [Melia azedarach]